MAVAAGVNVMLRPETSIMVSKAGFLGPDQYCKAFDAAANGYVRGEGVGVVILRPLSKALADGDEGLELVHWPSGETFRGLYIGDSRCAIFSPRISRRES